MIEQESNFRNIYGHDAVANPIKSPANGALAESYRDDGNRWLFQNANTGWNQSPKPPCAEVLTGGPIVDAVWRRLLDRAGPRPHAPLTNDPDLHLLVDGCRLDAEQRTDGHYVFVLPTAVRCVQRRNWWPPVSFPWVRARWLP